MSESKHKWFLFRNSRLTNLPEYFRTIREYVGRQKTWMDF